MMLEAILAAILPTLTKILPDPAARQKAQDEIKAALVSQQGDLLKARAGIIEAEAQSQGWLARNWRPLAMLNFLGLLDAYWFGLAPGYLTSDPGAVNHLFSLLTIGIGGYIGAQTVEKVVPHITGAVSAAATAKANAKTGGLY